MRIKQSEIYELLERVAKSMDIEYERENAKTRGQECYLYAEYANCYGGWRLVAVDVNSGGHSNRYGINASADRMSTKEFYQYLRGILFGLNFKK